MGRPRWPATWQGHPRLPSQYVRGRASLRPVRFRNENGAARPTARFTRALGRVGHNYAWALTSVTRVRPGLGPPTDSAAVHPESNIFIRGGPFVRWPPAYRDCFRVHPAPRYLLTGGVHGSKITPPTARIDNWHVKGRFTRQQRRKACAGRKPGAGSPWSGTGIVPGLG